MSFAEIGYEDDSYDETEDLAALELERRREQAPAQSSPAASTPWQPPNDVSRAIWDALPSDGRGMEYWRLVRSVAGSRWPSALVQVALAGLVLLGRAYVCPVGDGASVAGRGSDPRVPFPYRTGDIVF